MLEGGDLGPGRRARQSAARVNGISLFTTLPLIATEETHIVLTAPAAEMDSGLRNGAYWGGQVGSWSMQLSSDGVLGGVVTQLAGH